MHIKLTAQSESRMVLMMGDREPVPPLACLTLAASFGSNDSRVTKTLSGFLAILLVGNSGACQLCPSIQSDVCGNCFAYIDSCRRSTLPRFPIEWLGSSVYCFVAVLLKISAAFPWMRTGLEKVRDHPKKQNAWKLRALSSTAENVRSQRRGQQEQGICFISTVQGSYECGEGASLWQLVDVLTSIPSGFALPAEALPKVELLEVVFAGNHSLASDYGASYEPYGMYMESGEPYSEPLLIDASDSGSIHIVYHHCPYTDAMLRGWKFHGNQFITAEPGETPLLLQRRQKMCVARRVEMRSDGEQEGSELTLNAGDQQEPRFFGYRVDEQGYIAYFVAFTRMLPSICVYLKCCIANSNMPCEIVFYDVRNPKILSQFEHVVGSSSVTLSRECPLCLHNGGEDGVPLSYFTSIEDDQLSDECPNLKPHTYGDSFVFLGPGKDGSRVHKHYAIGSLSNTLQIRQFAKMTQVSVQYPNNLWLSRAGAYHENFNPPEAMRSYYIVRGAEYTTADESRQRLQEVLFYYDSLANAQENKGTEFISSLKTPQVANTKIPDAIFAEHPIANDMTYFYSNPIGNENRFVAGGGFQLPASKFVSLAAIKGFCVAPLFYDQWAVFLALEEPVGRADQQRESSRSPQRVTTNAWETAPLPWWSNEPLPEYSSARRGQLLYMQVPISGTRSYNEVTLQVFNADTFRSFHCSPAGSASVLLLHHDAVNHILHMEERFRDGSLRADFQIEIRRVLHESLLPSRTVASLQKGPDSVLWINLLSTKRFSVDESYYYVPAELPGKIGSVQRATGFYADGDCLGEWYPSLSSATCSEFCVSLHAYQVRTAARGGAACAFQAGTELARHCFEAPCSRVAIHSLTVNDSGNGDGVESLLVDGSAKREGDDQHGTTSVSSYTFRSTYEEVQRPYHPRTSIHTGEDDPAASNELRFWQDNLLDTSAPVHLGADGVASAKIELEAPVDLWHLRIAFASTAGQANSGSAKTASFEFSLSVLDDSDEEIHTWETSAPPSPAAQSVWEAMDLRLYRAKYITIRAAQPFRIAEFQIFGMPLELCPKGGFLGNTSCSVPTVQRLRSHSSLDCQGAWSEWTACQADCRRKRQAACMIFFLGPDVNDLVLLGLQCLSTVCLLLLGTDGLCNVVFGASLLRDEDCYPSASRWSECIGCRQMRVWHILRAAAAGGKACPSNLFETRSCKTAEGCDVSPVSFPEPPDQPVVEDPDSTENDLMRPVGGIFLIIAVACILLLLAALEIWGRWGTSMAAYREVMNLQRQKDLVAAREQMREYKRMIEAYKQKLEEEQRAEVQSEAAELGQLESALFQHAVATVVNEDESIPAELTDSEAEVTSPSTSEASRGELDIGEESDAVNPT
ncbi:uncharacterized protein LOC34620698 [Cyclospora cayetanensis]|uniref:Uncharacterized protein LOC34620698 n=1 Tax=Cyclospora cayetanensis TaxID=88456 RepID=A0A6P6RZ61_9EIME|nr:uncharacterized protein LOC34620698 [Cyclospora cayetanensis]